MPIKLTNKSINRINTKPRNPTPQQSANLGFYGHQNEIKPSRRSFKGLGIYALSGQIAQKSS